MGTASLRQLLKSLCTGSNWDYAVFWKLRHQNPKFLSWEDIYFDHPKPRMPMENLSEWMYNGCANQYQTSHVVAGMSCLLYAMGEGLVGKAACTGNDYWISSQDISTIQFKYDEPLEFPDEWIPQFMEGFQTVLLVPVLPHGVLQLGSLEVIAEDTTVSDCIKERYYAHRIVSGISSSSPSKQDTSWHASLAYIASFMDEMDDQAAITCSPVAIVPSEESDNITNTNEWNISTFDPAMPLQKILEDAMENKDSVPSLGRNSEVLIPINQPSESSQTELLQNHQFSASCVGEDLSGCSIHSSLGVSEVFSPRIVTRNIVDGEEMGFEKLSSLFSFPLDCELYKAVGPALYGQMSGFQEDEYHLSNRDLQRSSCLTDSRNLHFVSSQDFLDSMEPSAWDFEEFPCRGEAEECLEAVVSTFYCSVDDRLPYSSDDLKPSVTSLDYQSVASAVVPTKSEAVVGVDYSFPWGSTGVEFTDAGGNTPGEPSTSASLKSVLSTLNDREQQNGEPSTPASLKSVHSILNDREQQNGEPSTPASLKSVHSTLNDKEQQKGYSSAQAKEGKKRLTGGKRKARPSDNQKPRPRDRQLIQDRVKELRELVPSGSKCSIDVLLDQTIKHMAFLRGVTDQAEKLRKCVPTKKSSSKIWKPLGAEDGYQRGKSRVLDLESEHNVYPIVVEDLENQGHLLIEMLCEEQGLFLEIAQVIRRLDLTILKGVMESRPDNYTWASFIVEASKGFQRTDIFWPLMQLLQRQGNWISTVV